MIPLKPQNMQFLTANPGTRSVSRLSPSQVARKRANDRQAQRAIRARTKQQIERLEREVEALRSQPSRDRTIQELLRQNKALEVELRLLRERKTGTVSTTSSPYSAPTGKIALAAWSPFMPAALRPVMACCSEILLANHQLHSVG